MNTLTNAVDIFVDGTRPVKLSNANSNRKVINIWAGDTDLWYGGRTVKSGTIGHKVTVGQMVEVKTSAEIWVIRVPNTAGKCSFSEEYTNG